MSNHEPLRMEGEINLKEIDKAEEIVERSEGATRKLRGFPASLITIVAIRQWRTRIKKGWPSIHDG